MHVLFSAICSVIDKAVKALIFLTQCVNYFNALINV